MQRCAGILLHPTSLPSPYGIGDIGETAYAWLKLLHTNGITFWQMLPVGPTGYGNSPYQCLSAYAGNPLLISPNLLKDDGLLFDEDLKQYPILPSKRVVYDAVAKAKEQLFRKAFDRFTETNEYSRFCIKEQAWLDDYALFDVLRRRYSGRPWNSWEPALADRDAEALAAARSEYDYELRFRKFLQFVFFKQWKALRTKAKKLGIAIMGDVPIYVAYDSADVWAYPGYFELDGLGSPIRVAGVPPDYFSKTGQLWGNPLYKWDVMKQDGFAWWISRIRTALEISDYARLDHFRAFDSYWAVSAKDATACNGTWVKGPGMELFKALRSEIAWFK